MYRERKKGNYIETKREKSRKIENRRGMGGGNLVLKEEEIYRKKQEEKGEQNSF